MFIIPVQSSILTLAMSTFFFACQSSGVDDRPLFGGAGQACFWWRSNQTHKQAWRLHGRSLPDPLVPSATRFHHATYTTLQHAFFACLISFIGAMGNTVFYPNGPSGQPLLTTTACLTTKVKQKLHVMLLPYEPTIEDLQCLAHWIREDPTAYNCMLLIGSLQPVTSKKANHPQLYGILLHSDRIRQCSVTDCLPSDAIQHGWHVYLSFAEQCLIFSHLHASTDLPPVHLPSLSKLGLKVWKHNKEDRFLIVPHCVQSPPRWDEHEPCVSTGDTVVTDV